MYLYITRYCLVDVLSLWDLSSISTRSQYSAVCSRVSPTIKSERQQQVRSLSVLGAKFEEIKAACTTGRSTGGWCRAFMPMLSR